MDTSSPLRAFFFMQRESSFLTELGSRWKQRPLCRSS
jgi:hypothetical protein